MDLKCTAILGNFFMKSDQIRVVDTTRTNFRMVEVKSENVGDKSEKTLSLFDDTSYRDEDIFSSHQQRTSNDSSSLLLGPQNLFIFAPIWTLLLKFLSVLWNLIHNKYGIKRNRTDAL